MALACTSCSKKPVAELNDLTTQHSDEPKFRITLVDGVTPERKTNAFVTVPPLVLVSPGHHKITVQRGLSDPPDTKTYELEVDAVAKSTYNLISKDGKPELELAK
jgi:hypothetical protein